MQHIKCNVSPVQEIKHTSYCNVTKIKACCNNIQSSFSQCLFKVNLGKGSVENYRCNQYEKSYNVRAGTIPKRFPIFNGIF